MSYRSFKISKEIPLGIFMSLASFLKGNTVSLQVLEVEGSHFVTRPQPLPPLEAKRPELLHKSVDGEEEAEACSIICMVSFDDQFQIILISIRLAQNRVLVEDFVSL